MEHHQHRLNLNHALANVRIRCLMAVLIGLLMATGNAAAGLWVANENSNTLADFEGKLKSGATKPHRVLNDSAHLDGPSTIAFDGNGSLWVTNFNSNTIFAYTG